MYKKIENKISKVIIKRMFPLMVHRYSNQGKMIMCTEDSREKTTIFHVENHAKSFRFTIMLS